MSNHKNKISTYRIIDNELLSEAGFIPNTVRCFYNENHEFKELEITDETNGVIFINEIDDKWSPLNNELTIEQQFTIKHPALFFGENSVTANENKIGLGVHIHSKTSNIQYKKAIQSFGRRREPIELTFNHTFNKNELRGSINIDFFLYLDDKITVYPLQAQEKGMILSDGLILSLELVVDGDGSIFPIREVQDKKGPLWSIEKNWADPIDDPFDINHVAIKLNTEHSLFNQIIEDKSRAASYIMNDIIIQSMVLIIYEVIVIDEINIEEYVGLEGNSILAVVKYWITTFEVDITDIFTITNSLRKSLG